MASYPTSVKTFTAKTDGVDDVLAEHVNSIQDEVTAIETVHSRNLARYTRPTAQTITTGVTTIIDFTNGNYNPKSLVTTGAGWKFTATVAGYYLVSCQVNFQVSAAWATGERMNLQLHLNGSFFTVFESRYFPPTTEIWGARGTTLVFLNVGDYIDIRVDQNSGSNLLLTDADGGRNWVAIALISG